MSRALRELWLCASFGVIAACGESFEASDAARGGSGNRPASGGAGSGGAAAGSGGVVGVGGLTGIGGVLGVGGIGLGGVTGGPFPATSVLDDFNRADGDLGSQWIGSVNDFELVGQQLNDRAGVGTAVFWAERFGPSQELFARLTRFDGTAPEINLVLKAQDDPLCEYIEVVYQPINEAVEVHFCVDGGWIELGGAPVVMTPGDTLGARISAAGQIEVFQNGARFLILDTSEFPHQSGGYIGVNSLDPSAAWDDFGGG